MSVDMKQYEGMSARERARAAFRSEDPSKSPPSEMSAREKAREAFNNPFLEKDALDLNLKGRTRNNQNAGIEHDANCAKPCCSTKKSAAEHICVEGDGCSPFDKSGHIHVAGDGCEEAGIKEFNIRSSRFENDFGTQSTRDQLKGLRINATLTPAALVSDCAKRNCGHDHSPKPPSISAHKNCSLPCCDPSKDPANSFAKFKTPYPDMARAPHSGVEQVNHTQGCKTGCRCHSAEMIQAVKPVNRIAEIINNLPQRVVLQEAAIPIPNRNVEAPIPNRQVEAKTERQEIKPRVDQNQAQLQHQLLRRFEAETKPVLLMTNQITQPAQIVVQRQGVVENKRELIENKNLVHQFQKIRAAAEEVANRKQEVVSRNFDIVQTRIVKTSEKTNTPSKIEASKETIKESKSLAKDLKSIRQEKYTSSETKIREIKHTILPAVKNLIPATRTTTGAVQLIRPGTKIARSSRVERVVQKKDADIKISLDNRDRKTNNRLTSKGITSQIKTRISRIIDSKLSGTKRLEVKNKSDVRIKAGELRKVFAALSQKTLKSKVINKIPDPKLTSARQTARLVFDRLVKKLEMNVSAKVTVSNGLSLSILKAFKVYKLTNKNVSKPNVSKQNVSKEKQGDIVKGINKLFLDKEFTKQEKHILIKASEALFKYFEERIISLKNEELWLYLLMLLGIKKRKSLETDEDFHILLREFISLDAGNSDEDDKREKVISLLKHILTHYSHLLDINERKALKKRYDTWNSQQMI